MGKIIFRVVITIAVVYCLAYFLCDIKPGIEYGWLAGFWHGLFLIPNVILHFIDKDILYFAEQSTLAYKIFFGLGLLANTLFGQIIQVFSSTTSDADIQ